MTADLSHFLTDVVRRTDMVRLIERYAGVSERAGRLMAHCPFHPSATASMVIDPELHICFCFDCNSQWGPIDLVMKLERLSFADAVRFLAAEASIDIAPDILAELTSLAEHDAVTPAVMFEANRFAARHFHSTLLSTPEGRDVGLAYFRERGLSDAMIERFNLGYAIEGRTHFFDAAQRNGISAEAMERVGLVVKSERGDHYDRYHGRVVFPVSTITGEPVAFGARTLRTAKDIAKYVNSPESEIYSKSNELYGLYQARHAIETKNRCILVEGYLDVISMHQAGIENVVAASGTSLTDGQVALLARFANRVTVIFDADAAGIKAAVRSIDMLLAADMHIDIVSLPPGDDPDSFAQSHSREQIEQYLDENAIDFIQFKLNLAAGEMARDPIARARVVADIVNSIAAVPDRTRMRAMISRTAFMLKINERTLAGQLQQRVNERLERRNAQRKAVSTPMTGGLGEMAESSEVAASLRPKEEELLGFVVRNALLFFCDTYSPDSEEGVPTSVIDYVAGEMRLDSIKFSNPDFDAIFNAALTIAHNTSQDQVDSYQAIADEQRDKLIAERRNELIGRDADMRTIEREERIITEQARQLWDTVYERLSANHVALGLLAHPDDDIRHEATRLIRPRSILSRIHTRHTACETEQQRLGALIPHALCAMKAAIVKVRIDDITRRLSTITDFEEIRSLMTRRIELDRIKAELAPYIGDRVIT